GRPRDTAALRRVRRRSDRLLVILAHLDLDAFFAAVEELEAPELREKPLVVGGDPHGRGVVATANYAARRFGIHSAMSCAEALRRCPQAVFLRPRHRLYKEYSRAVWDAVREVVPTVERTGMDEGYLDVGEVAADFGRRRSRRSATWPSCRTKPYAVCCRGSSARCSATARAGSTRGRSSSPPRRSRSAPRRPSSATSPTSSGSGRSCAGSPSTLPS